MKSQKSLIQSHGDIDQNPKEIYGSGPVTLRIGNGGAGATGLLAALAKDYLSTISSSSYSITWVCNHSRNSQLALLHDYVDIALTYERDQEQLAQTEGWSFTAGCAFHDHFCLAGPVSDPAGVLSAKTLSEAFSFIARHRSLFHSRADTSATMWKEHVLWRTCALSPWEDKNAVWYKTSLLSPGEALVAADSAGAYLLTDRSTLLCQTAKGTIKSTTVFFEPNNPHDILMNSCFALHAPEPNNEVENFVRYLFSQRGQAVIASFGVDEVGIPLFAPVDDGYARFLLKEGTPEGRKWISLQLPDQSIKKE